MVRPFLKQRETTIRRPLRIFSYFFLGRRAFDKGRRRRVERATAGTSTDVYNDCTRFVDGVSEIDEK